MIRIHALKKNCKTIVFSLIISFIAVGVLFSIKNEKNLNINKRSSVEIDNSINGNVQDGGIKVEENKIIKAELQKKADSSYMNYKINLSPVFKDGNSKGNLMIENSADNNCLLQVELKNIKTGVTMYKTPVLKPNQSIQEDNLIQDFPKGTYEVMALFNYFSKKEVNNFLGSTGIKLKLNILN